MKAMDVVFREWAEVARILGPSSPLTPGAIEARAREVVRENAELRHEVNTLRAREASKSRAALVAERDEARRGLAAVWEAVFGEPLGESLEDCQAGTCECERRRSAEEIAARVILEIEARRQRFPGALAPGALANPSPEDVAAAVAKLRGAP